MSTSCLYRQTNRSIPTKESHALWGKSAGRCAFPNCPNKCIDSLENSGTILIGEMAHVLAHAKKGPRAADTTNDSLERYDNLILLCPYHHTLVDKAPTDFPAELLRQWKADLEHKVENALDAPTFLTKTDLYKYVEQLLTESKFLHDQFGPTSETAQRNPISNLQRIWETRKLEKIIPNNSLIIAAFKRYQQLVSKEDLVLFDKFHEHAVAFAAGSASPLDSVPMFPVDFANMISRKED